MRILLDDTIEYHENGTATITKRSLFTQTTNSRTMPLTREQYRNWVIMGMFIQDAMPHLSVDDREFLMTGATPEEWKASFGSADDDSKVLPFKRKNPALLGGQGS